ncbi:MAG: polysaccharide biosynthesis/export family protein [Rhodomicrobium sp.]
MGAKTLGMLLAAAAMLCGCHPQDEMLLANASSGAYHIGPGDQVRVIVFSQPALSSIYGVDASGNISLPLVGFMKAESKTTRQVEAAIASRLKENDFVTDPKVAVEVVTYRPFSILGEVRAPGRFAYAPGMSVEGAIALAGGYTIHADKDRVLLRRRTGEQVLTAEVSPLSTFQAGDTLVILERWL